MATSTNMLLIIPEVGVTVGPDWANQINASLSTIDAHDHTSGKGVQIPTAGLAINADLSFNTFGATNLAYSGYVDQSSDPSILRSIYTKLGELFYQDSAGNIVQITSAGQINVNTGEITYKLITTYPYNVLLTDTNNLLGITTTSARTVNLPAASNNLVVYLKDITGNAETNNITVVPDGSDTIDGQANFVLEGNYEQFGFVSDGNNNWNII